MKMLWKYLWNLFIQISWVALSCRITWVTHEIYTKDLSCISHPWKWHDLIMRVSWLIFSWIRHGNSMPLSCEYFQNAVVAAGKWLVPFGRKNSELQCTVTKIWWIQSESFHLSFSFSHFPLLLGSTESDGKLFLTHFNTKKLRLVVKYTFFFRMSNFGAVSIAPSSCYNRNSQQPTA